ncbi:uncharacterized protein LOC105686318 [Athalia rosae]|uniref:uncharacterized protein LOC105686318 n=1 Tax=Athalia rosae TaxID=37344 RepID=UPI0020338F61|nr:uncharacterized protein LOC105686318 [Athalia rosae]
MSENALELSDVRELNDLDEYMTQKKYTSVWEQPNAIDILLDTVGSDEYIYKLTNAGFKKRLVWEEIAAKVTAQGIVLGDNPCKIAYQKWLNLKKHFISLLNKKTTHTPAWFEKLSGIFEKSEGKLLGIVNLQGEEEREEMKEEPVSKKTKQEFLPAEMDTEGQEEGDGEVHIQIDPGQYVIEEVTQVTLGDVVAIMQQLETERREREEAREKREKERFDKLADLLRQQNASTERLISILSKQSNTADSESGGNIQHLDPTMHIATNTSCT